MGMLSTQSEPTIHHFSHPHPLHLSNHNPQQTLNLASCSGCTIPLSGGLTYTCKLCNYYLHIKCSQMPQQIKHPFDPAHVFSLLPTPLYPEGSFNCDACGNGGKGFSYHCKDCGTDLHILCASMPLSTTHQSHRCNLSLIFSPPYLNKSFVCDVCKEIGGNHWLYRCSLCEFDAHLNCATTQPTAQAQAQAQGQMPMQFNQYQYRQAPVIPVIQHPPRMPAQLQQLFGGNRAAPTPRAPTPRAFVNTASYMNRPANNFMNVGNTGVMGLNRPGTSQINQAVYDNALGPAQDARQQILQGLASGVSSGGNGNAQSAQSMLNNGINGGNGSGVNAQTQIMQAILNTYTGGSVGDGASANAQMQTMLNAYANSGCGNGDGGAANAQTQLLQAILNVYAGGGGGGSGGGGGGDEGSESAQMQLMQAILNAYTGGGGSDVGGASAQTQLMHTISNAYASGGGGDGSGANAQMQLMQALLNVNAGSGGGGGGGFDQLLQGLMGGGGGSGSGGGFDINTLLGGNIDINSILGLMGGMGA